MGRLEEMYRRSLEDPEAFWAAAAAAIEWDEPWQQVIDDSRAPLYRWFAGGRMNTCYNALDRHVERGRADQPALIYDSPVTDTVATLTYRELRDAVALFAGALAAQGVTRGDRVIVYMPMVPEAVIAMLACARLGAIHSVVFGGFAANELATRIEDAKPKVIVSASCGIEPGRLVEYKPLLDAAIGMVESKPEGCIVLQRPMLEAMLDPDRDVEWNAALTGATPAACVSVDATDPLYILYTSGTTGQPKGIVRDNGGHAVALAWTMKNIYDVDAGEVYWAASDIGWTVGHSYTVYAPLFHGCTTVLYEGKPVGTPDAGAFWRGLQPVHRTNGLPRNPPTGPQRRADRTLRPIAFSGVVSRRRALRPRDAQVGRGATGRAGDRPLLADRDRMACCGQLRRHRAPARRARIAHQAGAGMGPSGRRRRRHRSSSRRHRRARRQAAPPSRLLTDALERGRSLPRHLPLELLRLLRDGRRRLHRRERLRLRDGSHRRHHQCRRAPTVNWGDRGGPRRASRRRRVRGRRRRRRTQRTDPARAARPQSWSRARARRDLRRNRAARPRARGSRRRLQAGGRG